MATLDTTLTVLLVARKGNALDEAQARLLQMNIDEKASPSPGSDRRVYVGTTLDDVQSAFDQAAKEARTIQHVFVGAGLELELRLEIVKEAISRSGDTCVHLKDATSGPSGFLPFIQAVLGDRA
ncbi:hypothetical protein AYO21_05119 [Fonsecaea monophora]|uniref:Uncharacterized protein n=1 Tax=Fonsecaea monophora TaxID=254056 RepID=A0A177F8T2_9EURO|nr:hypothetical protein AYO21_05119 [Fonsecaea monophora]KAH0832431.1 hypothetical protein FOPE_01255 [Fonsecaea pedrosoi]OAG40623.1 hypothetical protein AYO21_05119 [Fonsecaea monophora]